MTLGLPWALPWGRRGRDAPSTPAEVEAAAGAQARFGGDDEPTAWVTVFSAGTLEEAHVVKGALETENIPALLRYETHSLLAAPVVRGVDVRVPAPLEARARAVLEPDG